MEIFQHLYRTKSTLQFLKNAKESGFKILGTGLKKEKVTTPASFHNYHKRILLLGNEGSGLSDDILNLCDENLQISSHLNVNSTILDSLNVSVATGILLDRLQHRAYGS